MLFGSIKECHIYLKVTIEKNWRSQNFDFLSLKKIVLWSVFGESQLTQVSLNFRNQRSGSKTFVAFLLF